MLDVNKAIELMVKHDGHMEYDPATLSAAITEARRGMMRLQKLDIRAPEVENRALIIEAINAVNSLKLVADSFCKDFMELLDD